MENNCFEWVFCILIGISVHSTSEQRLQKKSAHNKKTVLSCALETNESPLFRQNITFRLKQRESRVIMMDEANVLQCDVFLRNHSLF